MNRIKLSVWTCLPIIFLMVLGRSGIAQGCSSTVSSFPYSEGFETVSLGGWTQDTGDDFDWTRNTGSTSSHHTGPSSATEGSFYMYGEASSPNYPYKVCNIESPCFDFSSLNNPSITFQNHMYGNHMGTLNFQVSLDGTNWTTLWTRSGNQGNAWNTVTLSLAAYAGNASVRFRFNGITKNNFKGDFAVDDFAIVNLIETNCSDGVDNDGDGVADCFDGDCNGSGPCTDSDGDGITNIIDLDDDNDGIPDTYELCGSGTATAASITIKILLDDYGSETGWSLSNSGGTIYSVSAGTYSNFDPKEITYTYSGSLGDYTFTITDTYGDGLCCSYGVGHYEIQINGNTIIGGSGSSSGSFYSTASEDFSTMYSTFDCLSGNPGGDQDADGIVNYRDADWCTLNGNGTCASLDADGDGIPNHLDYDSDGDNCLDAEEAGHGIVALSDSTIAGPFGTNGLPNAVETSSDSGNPNYTVSSETNDSESFSACATVVPCIIMNRHISTKITN